MLAPATGFYGTSGLGMNEVRLAYVLNLESITGAMDCLEKALEQYPGRSESNFPRDSQNVTSIGAII
jgi:aspartate aminotransferase